MADSPAAAGTPVAILCGGRGTRLQEHTHAIPKALVEIGGKPILWHVIRIYAAQGFRRFLLLTGYLGDQIEAFAAAERWPEAVEIECVDTGLDTPTGGRVALAADRLVLVDLLPHLLRWARRHRPGGRARVPQPARGGGDHDRRAPPQPVGDRAGRRGPSGSPASRRSRRLDYWINGGFFVCAPALPGLGRRGQRARARAAGAASAAVRARRLPPRRLLGLHGHLQGRGHPQRPLELRLGRRGGSGSGRRRSRN